ncbi:ribonuclease J [Olegusella massiliensis]|uniref:ribonuclease J n=1 Tax=Olegusella massiliensis TaxID=1776381 RepID=UPI000837B913|nr:ribonuclease J [Olegusella massiliensis]MBS5866089.1 ribonuclease J [Coriobacteriaceae bacterium]
MAKKQTPLRIIPLGGLDGIGKNMTAFEYGDDMILLDAGLMFPEDNQPGIDLILPDYSYVLENEHKLRGILITHGHEDHTGALPYLLADLNHKVPIYSSKMTLGIVEGKLAEHKINSPRFREVQNGTHINLGNFSIDFFSVTHSIPGALGVYIRTPAGSVLHTCDFKLDQTPIDGVRTNFQAISRFATMGIDLLLSDSTNATQPGFTPSEATVGPTLRHIIKNAPGRVFVASFSSHIHRIQQVCDAATSVGRKVVVTGRSMVTNTRVARELGYLHVDEKNLIDAFEIGEIPDDKVVVMCTGSQGEPMSALGRMATGDHKSLQITANDTVIISATPVPGNEKSVQGIINALTKIGCTIYDKTNATVHVSGHARQEELKLMLALCKPHYFAPVHGEAVHLAAHAKLAMAMGMPKDHIFIANNGDALEVVDGKLRWGKGVESGLIYVDGLSISNVDPILFRDRQKLSEDGIITVVVTVGKRSHKANDIEFSARGVAYAADEALMSDATANVRQTVERQAQSKGASVDQIRRTVRGSLSNFIWSRTHTRPMVIPVVMEV